MMPKKRDGEVAIDHPQELKNSSVETDNIDRLLELPTSMDSAVEKTLDGFEKDYRRIIAEKEAATG